MADEAAAQSAQMTDIIRRRGDLPSMPRPAGAFPALRSSHLVLADYLNTSALMSMAVSPGDRNRLRWFRDPAAYLTNQLQPQPDVTENELAVSYLFSSSYELPPAFYAPDYDAGSGTVAQGPTHSSFFVLRPSTGTPVPLGARPTTQVAFSSNKVLLYESAQQDLTPNPTYWAYEHARVPVLMADGSAAVRVTDNANPGFRPNDPRSPFPTILNYQPRPWEPPLSTTAQTGLAARFRFTRWGLQGRDFDGQDAPSPLPPF